MSLAEVFEEVAESRRPHQQCAFVKIYKGLDAEDAAFVDGLMGDDNVLGTTIAETLTRAGHRIAAASVQRHRRKACTCESR